jgi:hypothetical protein
MLKYFVVLTNTGRDNPYIFTAKMSHQAAHHPSLLHQQTMHCGVTLCNMGKILFPLAMFFDNSDIACATAWA